ncbi:hypothetical protein GA0061098_1013187 [Bradyrhizobium shewense]|uniref:DUF4864 domain-containing protein n=2 Tax=Bradyrhizobium shewense TaxID=1761772 RepID=A0A1C3XAF1_9BRAD|nr:hypothetical protein GA0061098_1013187 [Bradyrhizobium shewense]
MPGFGNSMQLIARAVMALALLLCCGSDRAMAQQKTPAPAAAAAQPALPVTLEQALYLIRSTLLTLNDANRTGNYTVLRDLAAPDFQARNTAADLALNFLDLRRRNFDLYGAALLAPQFSDAPALDQRGMLRLAGYIPTRPQQIQFDLTFQTVAGQWRLIAIAIATPEAASPQPQAQVTPVKPAVPAQKKTP